MKRVVKMFFWESSVISVERMINKYAEDHGCTIISVTPIEDGCVAAIFEEEEEQVVDGHGITKAEVMARIRALESEGEL